MTLYPLFPLQPALIEAVKSTYGLETNEEACQPAISRRFLNKMFEVKNAPEVEKQDLVIQHDGLKVSVSILRPLGSQDKVLPVLMFLHGGGWVVGGYETHSGLSNSLVVGLSCCVVFVNYSKSPEVKYPVPIKEGSAVLSWMKKNSESLRIDYKTLVVAGDSAGGNLAAGLALHEKALGNNDISFQLLIYPATHDNFETESYIQNQDNMFLPRDLMRYFWDAYSDDAEDRKKNTMVPLVATLQELKGLPPAFVISAEHDVLRCETEAYASKLIEAGVNTVTVRYLDTNHGFLSEAVLSSQGVLAVQQVIDVLRKHWDLKKI
ncbi:alpha/beta hydrolase fold-domain-containing protein [Thamnidium elegans]|uniref:Alpha/beta hydrolase fold-3 domain-containing protein n=1 Tax=Thamnidium elegans TaxID=101142 RepID=A0A8H7SL43_9FUNG|nr:hypothetical protein INT48_001484 [Thamnidium elegans]KAI8071835.1 alpha/beta hydrolase fold-domain-containing protein [Thamnidium elegans]